MAFISSNWRRFRFESLSSGIGCLVKRETSSPHAKRAASACGSLESLRCKPRAFGGAKRAMRHLLLRGSCALPHAQSKRSAPRRLEPHCPAVARHSAWVFLCRNLKRRCGQRRAPASGQARCRLGGQGARQPARPGRAIEALLAWGALVVGVAVLAPLLIVSLLSAHRQRRAAEEVHAE